MWDSTVGQGLQWCIFYIFFHSFIYIYFECDGSFSFLLWTYFKKTWCVATEWEKYKLLCLIPCFYWGSHVMLSSGNCGSAFLKKKVYIIFYNVDFLFLILGFSCFLNYVLLGSRDCVIFVSAIYSFCNIMSLSFLLWAFAVAWCGSLRRELLVIPARGLCHHCSPLHPLGRVTQCQTTWGWKMKKKKNMKKKNMKKKK